jgi:hypothetical protein
VPGRTDEPVRPPVGSPPPARDAGATVQTAATSTRLSRLRDALEAHLGSRDVARVIYGAIIGLALVVALGQHPPTAVQTTAAIIATAVAVGLAEIYSEYVGVEARERRRPDRAQVRQLGIDALAVGFGASVPAVFFVLAVAGAIEIETAFQLAKWTGLGLICLYGFLAGRLAGSPVTRALAHASALGVIAGALIALKALLH